MIPREHWPTEQNWDGYGAVPTTEIAMIAAETISFVPTVIGGFQIEFYGEETYVEVEISPQGEIKEMSGGQR